MKIFDCFTFNNELDLLEIRLAELNSTVDYFVLAESSVTFTNNEKPCFFAENASRFQRFSNKIIYVPVNDMPRHTNNPWVREQFQRNALFRGLGHAMAEDYIIISDVDEIPKSTVISQLAQGGSDVYGLRLWLFSLRLNYLNLSGPEVHRVWPVIIRRRLFETAEATRAMRTIIDFGKQYMAVDDGGWHFSSIGDSETVRSKIKNTSHQEFNRPDILEAVKVDGIIEDGRDLFSRDGYVWGTVPAKEWMPNFVLENMERFSHLVANCDSSAAARAALARTLITESANARSRLPHSLVSKVIAKIIKLVH